MPVARPATVTANPGCALGCTPTSLQGHRAEPSSTIPGQIAAGFTGSVAGRGPAGGASPARRPDSNRSTVRLLLYFAAVLGLNPGLFFSNCVSELWSYGDSNPRPLACHQQATHPPPSIAAGHRPATCTPVRPGPGRLRYFRAVLPRRAAGVHGRCGTCRRARRGRAFRSANDKQANAGYGNGVRGTGHDVGSCSPEVAAIRWTLLSADERMSECANERVLFIRPC
jgi:hypothetical protein